MNPSAQGVPEFGVFRPAQGSACGSAQGIWLIDEEPELALNPCPPHHMFVCLPISALVPLPRLWEEASPSLARGDPHPHPSSTSTSTFRTTPAFPRHLPVAPQDKGQGLEQR